MKPKSTLVGLGQAGKEIREWEVLVGFNIEGKLHRRFDVYYATTSCASSSVTNIVHCPQHVVLRTKLAWLISSGV